MYSYYLGIDPGAEGAASIIRKSGHNFRLIHVYEWDKKTSITEVAREIGELVEKYNPVRIACEGLVLGGHGNARAILQLAETTGAIIRDLTVHFRPNAALWRGKLLKLAFANRERSHARARQCMRSYFVNADEFENCKQHVYDSAYIALFALYAHQNKKIDKYSKSA